MAGVEGALLPWVPLSTSDGEFDPAGDEPCDFPSGEETFDSDGEKPAGEELPCEDPTGTAIAGPWWPEPGIPAIAVFDGPSGGLEPGVPVIVTTDVTELVMTDTDCVTWTISLVPEVTVLVTGQVVKVVYSLQKILADFPYVIN